MSEEVVALARKDGRLVSIVSVASHREEEPAPRYEIVERAIGGGQGGLRPFMHRAVEAWGSLREACWDDPRGLSSALTVLLESVPLGSGRAGAQPSAAQVGLCARNIWPRLRDALRSRERCVLRLLRDAGYGPGLAALAEARDPYLAYHHGAPAEPGLQALPPRFVAFVLPSLRSRPWPVVRRALALFWDLGLERDDTLLALAARLLAMGPEHGLAWLALMASEDPSRRDMLGRAVLATGALAHDPRVLPDRTLEVLAAADDECYTDRLELLLEGLLHGVDLEYLVEGVRVATTFSPKYRYAGPFRWYASRRGSEVPPRLPTDLWRMLTRFQESLASEWSFSFAIGLWDWCATTPARAAVLRQPALLSWPALTAYRVLRRLMYDVAPDWTEGERFAVAERMLARIPPSHQAKAVDALADLLERGRLDRVQLAAASELIVRMARPPFRSRCDSDRTVALLVKAAGTRPDRLAQVPERSLQRLERALCADDSWMLHQGLATMARAVGGFLLHALAAHPEPLVSAARHLGAVSHPRRLALLKRFRSHRLSQRRFARRPLEDVCRTLEGLVRRGLPNPIPRKLREHREGGRALSAGSLERHRQAVVRRLLPFRLKLLARMALEELGRGVEADLSRESERHALQMLASAWPNRRLLRRVLRVPPGDRHGFLESHPANEAWLARHPRVARDLWRTGVEETATLPDGRRLHMAFEPRPMEVLRMGTHVGSCLAAGGCHSGSAVAVMADVNKRVIFARGAAGAFVARQLVAIAEDDRLVFFPVYPLGCGDAVKDAFERYDRALGVALGLDVHCGPEDHYEIAQVLARGFYDDGAWDRLVVSV